MTIIPEVAQLLLLVVVDIIAAVIGILVIRSNPKAGLNRWFGAMSILMILWVSSAFMGSTSYTEDIALIAFRANYLFVALFLSVFYYFFVTYFVERINKFKLLKIIVFVLSIVLGVASVTGSYVIESVIIRDWGMELIYGPMFFAYNIFAVFVAILILYFSVSTYLVASQQDKRRLVYFFIGIAIFIFANIIFNIVLPAFFNTSQYQHLGDISGVFFLGFTGYAMAKHHLFDVKAAAVRSLTYSLVLFALALIYFVVVLFLSAIFDNSMANFNELATGVFISLVLAFVFQPLKRFFDKVTNKIFYKDNYNTDDFFTRVNESLTTTTDLRNLLERISHEIGNTLKSEQTFFYINTDNNHYVSAGTQHHRQLPKADADKLGELCGTTGDIVIASMLEPEDQVRRLMLSHRIELLLPLIESNKIIGYLCLGEHRSNSGYTNRDVKALNAVSDEITIAIQNALAVQEIREFNSTLQQRIENATKELRSSNSALRHLDKTKDEFVGMASHQLRTPLTSVKGYISMVLEGDAGKVSDMQRKFLEEAFMSSERMVRLIDDFLNVSRIQNGKFIIDKHEVDLAKVVEQEIDSLTPSAKMRNMKFVYNPPTDVPTVSVDEGKLRQVIMNFADNALYYSHDNTKIVISLSIQDKDIVFTVKDTGIGIPLSEQGQLFTKFYRASNARKQRPDGTGVGLYLAKKIIDAHGGKVIFLSIEGKGSMFGFRIPINQSAESTTAS